MSPADAVMAHGVVIVLVHPISPGNVGSVARAMRNFGLNELVVVDPPAFDLERARWMAAGASEALDTLRVVGTVAEAVADCQFAVGASARKRRWSWPVLEPTELARRSFDTGQRTAILFGREDAGLDNDALGHCQALLRIPTAGMASLNLAQAALVVCLRYFDEAVARGWMPGESRVPGPSASRDETPPVHDAAPLRLQEAAIQQSLDTLELTPYMGHRAREQVQVNLSRLLQRAQPSRQELEMLLGMISKTRWALKRGEET